MSWILSAICTNYAISAAFPSTVKVLVVGGGGGGASRCDWWGWAGGLIYDTAYAITNNTLYTVTVWTWWNWWASAAPHNWFPWWDSVFDTLTAIWWGGWQWDNDWLYNNLTWCDWGSWWWGSRWWTVKWSWTALQGNDGWLWANNDNAGWGGGWAGAVWWAASGTVAGNWWVGLEIDISGTPIYYAWGWGGWARSWTKWTGWLGWGGNGWNNPWNWVAGTNWLGWGWWAASYDWWASYYDGWNWGSWVVIISYVGSAIATGWTITTSGWNTIHTFTSSGSFTVGTPPVTYATWNPADKSSWMILETGNLVWHSNTTAWEWTIARSTIGKSSGKWYWEQTKDNSTEPAIMIAWILNISAPAWTNNYVWIDTNWWGYWGQNWYKVNWSQTAYWATYTNGDVIWIALDMDSGTLEFFKNWASQWVMATGLTGTQYAWVSTNDNWYHTVNFGASAFAYTPPTWFNAWLYA